MTLKAFSSKGRKQEKGTTKPDFMALYERWVTPIYQYFLSMVGETALAEDLTSQLFLKAYQAYPAFKAHGSLPGWLFAIAHNLAMDQFRADRRSRLYFDQQVHETLSPASSMIEPEALIVLQKVLSGLGFEEQELLRLRFLNRLSFADLGKALGISEQAAKKRTYRLLGQLKQRMGGNHD